MRLSQLLLPVVIAAIGCGKGPDPATTVTCTIVNDGGGGDDGGGESEAGIAQSPEQGPGLLGAVAEQTLDASVAPLPSSSAKADAAVPVAAVVGVDSGADAAIEPLVPVDPDVKKYRIIVSDDVPHMPGKAKKPPKPKKTQKELDEEEEERERIATEKKNAGKKKKKKKKKKNVALIDKDLLGEEDKPKPPKPKSHPDPRIVVDVLKVVGELRDGELQKLIRARSYGTIRHCYEEGLRRDQTLRGMVTFELQLSTTGKAETITRKDGLLKDESVAWCVGREMLRTAYPKEDAGNTVATVRVQLAPGDEQVASFEKHRKFDKLQELLREKKSEFEGCYRPSVEDDRTMGGAMSLRIRVLLNGDVERVDEFQTNFRDKDVTKCVMQIIKKMKFPRMSRREPSFVYPLHFEAVEE